MSSERAYPGAGEDGWARTGSFQCHQGLVVLIVFGRHLAELHPTAHMTGQATEQHSGGRELPLWTHAIGQRLRDALVANGSARIDARFRGDRDPRRQPAGNRVPEGDLLDPAIDCAAIPAAGEVELEILNRVASPQRGYTVGSRAGQDRVHSDALFPGASGRRPADDELAAGRPEAKRCQYRRAGEKVRKARGGLVERGPLHGDVDDDGFASCGDDDLGRPRGGLVEIDQDLDAPASPRRRSQECAVRGRSDADGVETRRGRQSVTNRTDRVRLEPDQAVGDDEDLPRDASGTVTGDCPE